MTVFKWF